MAWNKSNKKKELLQKAKDLGLKVNADMSEYELEHRIAEEEEQLKTSPKTQASNKYGEY